MSSFKHLQRDSSYQTVLMAIKKDHPDIARSMARMSDCISASIEILGFRYDGQAPLDYVVPMAIEIFKESNTPSNENPVEVLEDVEE